MSPLNKNKTPGQMWVSEPLCCKEVEAKCPFNTEELDMECEVCSVYLAAVFDLGWKRALETLESVESLKKFDWKEIKIIVERIRDDQA